MSKIVWDAALGQVDVAEGYAWAAVCLTGAGGAFVHSGVVKSTRIEVMETIGSVWSEDWRKGWRRSKRRGWRALRVSVEVSFGGRR
jgi:hypothetical protein